MTKAAIYCNNCPCILQQNLFISAISLPFLPSFAFPSLPSYFRSLQEDGWDAPLLLAHCTAQEEEGSRRPSPFPAFFFDCKKGIRYSNKVERRQAISNSPRNYKLPKLPVTPSGSGGGGGRCRSQSTHVMPTFPRKLIKAIRRCCGGEKVPRWGGGA